MTDTDTDGLPTAKYFLEKTANLIEEKGWFPGHDRAAGDETFCVWTGLMGAGGIVWKHGEVVDRYNILQVLLPALGIDMKDFYSSTRGTKNPVFDWNDAQKDGPSVVAKLREIADSL